MWKGKLLYLDWKKKETYQRIMIEKPLVIGLINITEGVAYSEMDNNHSRTLLAIPAENVKWISLFCITKPTGNFLVEPNATKIKIKELRKEYVNFREININKKNT